MSFTYNGDHSIMFIKADNSVDYASLTESSIEDYYDTWDSLYLIPESRPLINTPQPSISLYSDSATSKLIDLTDKASGGQSFGPRQGEWVFIVDHDRWSSWHEARKTLEKILNGQKLYCILSESFVEDVFMEIASKSIRFPGLIFSFSLEGFAWLIWMKILFGIIGFLFTACAWIFAILFSTLLAAVAFPFVLICNIKKQYIFA